MKKHISLIITAFAVSLLAGCGGKGTSSVTSSEHEHHWSYVCEGEYHYQKCDICGQEGQKEKHSGGHSTCEKKAVCSVCNHEYGELDEHTYPEEDQWIDAEDGSRHYHECTVCHQKEYQNHQFNKEVVDEKYLIGEYNPSCGQTNEYYLSCVCGASSHDETKKFSRTNNHVYTREVVLPDDANLYTAADCTHPARYFRVCEYCNEFTIDVSEVFTHGEALGHHYGEAHPERLTYSSYNCEYYQCDRCFSYFVDEREPGAPNPVYVEKIRDEIFDISRAQKNDPTAGVEGNPYLLATEEDLLAVKAYVQAHPGDDHWYELCDDIALGDAWTAPFAKFSGHLDGKGYSISGLSINREEGTMGLFSNLVSAHISNLDLEDFDITATSTTITKSQRASVLAGRVENSVISNVNVYNSTVTSYGSETGGLIGTAIGDVIVSDCLSEATVNANINTSTETPNNHTGGIVATVLGGFLYVENCTFAGTVNGGARGTGGILGSVQFNSATGCTDVKASIVNCTNNGRIVGGIADGVGGIVGWHNKASTASQDCLLSISNCVNNGEVTRKKGAGGNGIGGIFGINIDNAIFNIIDCENYGTVGSANSLYVGGIVGLARKKGVGTTRSSISRCYSAGNVIGKDTNNASFITGINRVDIHHCEILKTATKTIGETVTLASDLPAPLGSDSNTPCFVYGGQNNTGTTDVATCSLVDAKN